MRRAAPSPLVVVADHPEAADGAVATEQVPVTGTGHHAVGGAVGTHGGDRRAVVTGEAPVDLDDLPAVVEDTEAGGARSAGSSDASLSVGRVRAFVEVDPSRFLVAVTASAVTAVSALALLAALAAAG